MKEWTFASVIGIVGGAISTAFGGWDAALTTLIIFMAIDWVTGLMVAGLFQNSRKTDNGALESHAGFKGLCRKGVTLLIVLVSVRLDIAMQTTFIKDACIIAFVTNEAISIIENAGLMGVPIPKPLVKAIEVLRSKEEEDNKDDDA